MSVKHVNFEMTVKRKDFQKASAFINEFLLKLGEHDECAELRDALNLALLHMQRFYRKLRLRSQSRSPQRTLGSSLRDHSPMTPFRDTLEKFTLRWINLESPKLTASLPLEGSDMLQTLPLMIQAAKQGDEQLMLQLIEKDGDCVDSVDYLGRTALMYAAHFNKEGAINLLLQNKADVNAQAYDGLTVMHQVCHAGSSEILQSLIDNGADLSIEDELGRSAIHWAVTTQSVDCLKVLLSNGAKVRTCDADGLTPSMWACRVDNIHHFELLTTAEQEDLRGEDEDMELDHNGRTWMHWAVRRKEPLECLSTLLTEDTARLKDSEGKTVLLTAAELGSLDACKTIISIAGNTVLDDVDKQNRTALHLAAMGGHGEVINYLLEIGADLDCRDNANATPWDYAKARQLHYCMLIMSAHQRFRNRQENNNNNNEKITKENIPPPTISVSPHPPSKPAKKRPPSAPPTGKQLKEQTAELSTREVNSAGNDRKQPDAKGEPVEITSTQAFTECNDDKKESASIVIPACDQQELDENAAKDELHSENQHSFSGMDVSDLENEDVPVGLVSEHHEEAPPKIMPSPPPRRKLVSPVPPAVANHDEYVEGPPEGETVGHDDNEVDHAKPAMRHHTLNTIVDRSVKTPSGPALMPLQRAPQPVEPLQEVTKKKKKKKKKADSHDPQNILPPPSHGYAAPPPSHGYAGPLPPGGSHVGSLHSPPFSPAGVPHHSPHGSYAGPLHPPPPPNGGGFAPPVHPPASVRSSGLRPNGNSPPFDRPSWPPEPHRPGAPVPPNSARDPSPPANHQRLHKMDSEDNLSTLDLRADSSPENDTSSNSRFANINNKHTRYPPPPLHGPQARDQAKHLLGNRADGLKNPPSPQNVLSPMNRRKLPNSTLPPPINQGKMSPNGSTPKLSYGRTPPPITHAPAPHGGR